MPVVELYCDPVTGKLFYLTASGKTFLSNTTSGLPLHATDHQPGGGDVMTVDAVAATGSLRTIGTGAQQASAGNHTHAGGGGGNATVSHLVAYAALSKAMTNIGTTYKDIYVSLTDLGNDYHLIDFTGATSFRIVYFWDYVGTGTQQVRWVDRANNANVLWETAGFTADQTPGDSGWLALPAPFTTGDFVIEWQGKSTTAADDPVAKGFRIFLK